MNAAPNAAMVIDAISSFMAARLPAGIIHSDRLLHFDVGGGGAQHKVDRVVLHHPLFLLRIPVGEILRLKRHPDGFRLARLQSDALETFKFLDRPLDLRDRKSTRLNSSHLGIS